MIILSCDPGRDNFAYTIAHYQQQGKSIQVDLIESGLLESTPKSLVNSIEFMEEMRTFFRFFQSKIEEHAVEGIGAERYMSRGHMVGITSETVNICIGLIAFLARNLAYSLHLYSAATWKNAYNRHAFSGTLKGKRPLPEAYLLCNIPEHEVDSAFIGMHTAGEIFGINPFASFKYESERDIVLHQLEHVSGSVLNRRAKRRYHAKHG